MGVPFCALSKLGISILAPIARMLGYKARYTNQLLSWNMHKD